MIGGSVDVGTRSDLCRVTVVAPGTRMDVALPADVPLAELVPTLLRNLGADRPDAVPPSGGWSLQRFGQSPFDLGASAAALTVRDGEVLYLRPQQAELPELAFDDVSDAIATAAARGHRWTGSDTRRVGLALALLALATAVLVVLGAGPPWAVPAALSGMVALVLVVTAAVLSRALSDAIAGAVLGHAAVVIAVVAGMAAFAGPHTLGHLGAPSVLGGSAAGLLVAVVCVLAVAESVPEFVGVAAVAAFTLVTGALTALVGLEPAEAAAVAVVLALALVQAVPSLALRLAELPLPAIPFTADDVRRDDFTVTGADVLRRTAVADRYVTALLGAVVAVTLGGEVVLSGQHRASTNWMLAVVGAVLALRARVFAGRVQRSALLFGAAAAVALLAVHGLQGVPAQTRLVTIAVPLLLAAGLLVVVALRWHGTRVSPVWRRAADILDGLVVASVIPVALAVLGLYGFVRGYVG